MKRWIPFALAALTVTACQDASGPASQLRPVAPNFVSSRGVPIPGSYIVKFRDDINEQDVDNSARTLVKLHNGALKYVYKSALKGFAVQNLSAAAAAALASDPRVEFIEPDQVMSASTVQTPVTWGLDRVDQRALPLDNSYTYFPDGTGVTVYIIDTGINFTHPDFEGRASTGIDVITPGGTAEDCYGHGTHVSGTVGGKTYGIAKKVKLVAVRVLDCDGYGTSGGVIAGIEWVTANKILPAAANMSLGGGKDVLLNQAVAGSVAARVTYAVAAGNSTADACGFSPSSEPSAITVGATDRTDAFAYFSNYGTCVVINAPGVDVTSDWLGTDSLTISGTSMASPHVAGAAALYLSANRDATPAQVKFALTSNATPGVITGIPSNSGTPNLLLYTAFIAAPPPGPPAAPSLISPTDLAPGVPTSPTLSWFASSGATSYTAQVATDAGFTTLVVNRPGITTTSTAVTGLTNNTKYYWRVNATNTYGISGWSVTWSFTTTAAPPPCTNGDCQN